MVFPYYIVLYCIVLYWKDPVRIMITSRIVVRRVFSATEKMWNNTNYRIEIIIFFLIIVTSFIISSVTMPY